jgi:hypothetical protein
MLLAIKDDTAERRALRPTETRTFAGGKVLLCYAPATTAA